MRQLGSIALVIAAVTAAACSKSVDAPPPAQSAAERSAAAPADPDKPHHRDGDIRRDAPVEVVREYEFAGDRLILKPVGTTQQVIWERIR